MKTIAQGAEAIIYQENNLIIKKRIKKNYRHEILDEKIRKKTTRFETRLLNKASELIPVPKVLNSNDKDMIIEMEFIKGEKLRDLVPKISKEKLKSIFNKIGKNLAKLHNENIIHGDLTTSNIIINEKVYFIDFGLGFITNKIEDKAVDLHLLKQALESKHHKKFEQCFNPFIEGYKKEILDFKEIEERLNKVESRGRYKKRKWPPKHKKVYKSIFSPIL